MNLRNKIILSALTICLAPMALFAHCGHCGMGDEAPAKEGKAPKGGKHVCPVGEAKNNCPAHIEGASVTVENTADGAVIRVTAKDPKAIEAIQKAAVAMSKKECCGKSACGDCKHKQGKKKEGKKEHQHKGQDGHDHGHDHKH